MNTTLTTNQRLITVFLVLLIVLVSVIVIGVIVSLLIGTGMMGGMMWGFNGQAMNAMMSACTNMMQNFRNP
jgi:hypothetical protein